jgi:dipeptide/tripeptide permease
LIGSVLAVHVIKRIGARRTALLGALCVVAGQIAVSLWSFSPGLAWILLSLCVHGLGLGFFQVAYSDIVIATLPIAARGVAGGLTVLTRTIGVSTAATALAVALASIEAGALAHGASPDAALLGAVRSVFFYSALVLAALVALAAIAERARNP